jgi:hypothetical protein
VQPWRFSFASSTKRRPSRGTNGSSTRLRSDARSPVGGAPTNHGGGHPGSGGMSSCGRFHALWDLPALCIPPKPAPGVDDLVVTSATGQWVPMRIPDPANARITARMWVPEQDRGRWRDIVGPPEPAATVEEPEGGLTFTWEELDTRCRYGENTHTFDDARPQRAPWDLSRPTPGTRSPTVSTASRGNSRAWIWRASGVRRSHGGCAAAPGTSGRARAAVFRLTATAPEPPTPAPRAAATHSFDGGSGEYSGAPGWRARARLRTSGGAGGARAMCRSLIRSWYSGHGPPMVRSSPSSQAGSEQDRRR